MTTRIALWLTLAMSFAAASAFAQNTDALLYPLTSFLDWTGGPQRDLQDQALGQYQFQEGIVGAVNRAVTRYPEHLSSIHDEASARREAQGVVDALLHNRPDVPWDHWGDVGNPDYMPDWNHDGVYGGVGDFDADTDGDPHGDSLAHLDTAYFLYPCFDEGQVTEAEKDRVRYLTSGGTCSNAVGESYQLGVAKELKVVNARGLVLDATLWIPGSAFASPPSVVCSNPAQGVCQAKPAPTLDGFATGTKLPGVVFSNGLSSRQEHYYWFAMRMAAEGFIALTYDPAGQGESEGTWEDLFDLFDQSSDSLDLSGSGETTGCQFRGACRDVEDMVRWFVGAPMADVRGDLNDEQLRIAARKDPATNGPNPGADILDTTQVALAGNSMGALSTLHYLYDLGGPNGNQGMDGNPLPAVAAAISLSGSTPTTAVVPIQFQTSDYDGSPILVGPTVLGLSLGEGSSGIGYHLIKRRYNTLRDDAGRRQPIELVILEGGVHTDHAATPDITKTIWAIRLASAYAADWLNCHVKDGGDTNAPSCIAATGSRVHLSRALASEQAPATATGPASSRCLTIPDRAILNQPPLDFVNALSGKSVCDCTLPNGQPACDQGLSAVPY